MRGRGAGIAGNPVLIGAATTLVVLVAVFLAYNANKGLPFVPTYQLKAEMPSAANLVVGNDVRIGGARVGFIDAIEAKRRDDGTSIAELSLTLERDVAPLPRDSTLIVRPRSALGLKYVEITRGSERRGFDDGSTIPLAAATPAPVEFDEVLNMFDEDTRAAAGTNTTGFGDAFAGRGESLDRTFGALREVARPYIQDSISGAPPALDAAIRSFGVQRPFLQNTEGLFRELRPGVSALRTSAPTLADALEVGTTTLRRSPPFNRRLASLLDALREFSNDPMVPRGLRATSRALESLEPTLAFLEPAQTRCNYITLWFRNVSSLLSEGDRNGTWQRFIIIATPQGPDNEGGPSARPANGPTVENHVHINPYPNTGSPGQPRECEAGNERYLRGRTILSNVPETQQFRTEGNP